MNIAEKLGVNEDADFYPTPKEIAEKMLSDIDWRYVGSVLEPSAGKGDLADALAKKINSAYREINLDCIEKDENLQCLLRGKGYRVIHDDFLTFRTFNIVKRGFPYLCR